MTKANPYVVAPVELAGERQSVLHLWRQMPEMNKIPDSKLDWIYLKNPLGPATAFFARQGETPVGMIAVIPRSFQLNGRHVIAGAAADFGVLKEHRAFGPALGLQRAAATAVNEGKLGFLYGIPTERSIPVLNRIGYKALGKVRWLTKPLRIEAIRPVPVFGGVINAGLRLISKETWTTTQPDFRLESISSFDERVDRISTEMLKRYGCIASRTAGELNWRFAPGKGPRDYEAAGLFKHEELRAYVVGYRAGDRLHVADFAGITEADTEQLLKLLIARERALGTAAISTVFFGASSVAKQFKTFGFLDRPTGSELYIYATSALAELSRQIEDWYLFEGDTDM